MKKKKVYISYTHNPNTYFEVDILKKALAVEGYEIVIHENLPTTGQTILEHIRTNIISSDIIILVVTEDYNSSQLTMLEAATAVDSQKTLLPIVVGGAMPPVSLAGFSYFHIDDIYSLCNIVLKTLDDWSKYKTDSNPIQHSDKKEQSSNLEIVITALNKALEYNQLTLVCGAGVSYDSNIPTWSELLTLIIDRTLFDEKKSRDPNDNSAKELLSSMSQSSIILGKYLKLLSGDEFENNVKRALYLHLDMFGDETYIDTNMMDAIAELARPKRRGKQLDSIITFNFDDVIETKLKKTNIDYCSIWKEGQSHDINKLPIYHVHGFLPHFEEIDEPNLVFSEEAYHSQFIDPYSWSNLLQLNTFSNNICLFVGLSLSDPNLRRLLDISWRRNQRKKHYIIMKKTIVEGVTDKDRAEKEQIARTINMLFEQDANSLGLNVIWCNDFKEIPDILRKIAE